MVEILCKDIHEVIELLESLTKEKAHSNKIYDAIKRDRTYKGFRFSYVDSEETELKYRRVGRDKFPVIKPKKTKKYKSSKGDPNQLVMF